MKTALTTAVASLFFSFSIMAGQTGWNPATKEKLDKLVKEGAGKHLPVVFDFDNTVLCRDIGEATATELVEGKVVRQNTVPAAISPSFKLGDKTVSLHNSPDLFAYYEALGKATAHHTTDTTPLVESYVWLVQMMAGLTPQQIVEATQKAYAQGIAEKDSEGKQESLVHRPKNKSPVRRPFFYPQMVELIATLLQYDYEVWIVSASNPWSVRWMVTQALNPKLKALGAAKGIAGDHVIGLSVLLRGEDGKLYKDMSLAQEDPAYVKMEAAALSKYTLTSIAVHPVSTFEGKVANIIKFVGKVPYLVAGDSENDFAMLTYAQHRLFIARLNKPNIQSAMLKVRAQNNLDSWLIQPALEYPTPGFVASLTNLTNKIPDATQQPHHTMALLPK